MEQSNIFNLNDRAIVRLTHHGASVLNTYVENNTPDRFRMLKPAKGSQIREFTFWELMHIFGPEMYNGAPKMCFHLNDIVVKKRKK